MPIRQNSNIFRSNFLGDVQLSGFTGHTSGAYTVDQLPLTPPPQKVWTVLSVTIRGELLLVVNRDGTNASAYGKLGKIIAGLAPQTPQTSVGGSLTVTGLFSPPDQSLTETLWDPASNDLPPLYDQTPAPITATLPVSCTVTPANPIQNTGGILGVFIALQPSLTYNAELIVHNASWLFTYSDDTTLT